MKKFFTNLIPLAAYWLTFSFAFFIMFMSDSSVELPLPLSITLVAVNVIIGYAVNVRQMKWGLSVFLLQLVVCPIIYAAKVSYNIFFAVGNIAASAILSRYEDTATPPIIAVVTIAVSAVLLVGSFCLGSLIRKKVDK